MKEFNEKYKPEFSLFLNRTGSYFNVKPDRVIDLESLVESLRESPKLKEKTDEYRRLLDERGKGDQEVKKFKSGFPMITPVGQFTYKDNQGYVDGTYNSLCGFDIDLQDNSGVDFEHVWSLLQQDPHVLFWTYSVSRGLKGMIALDYKYSDPDSYKEFVVQYVYPHFENRWGVVLDKSQAVFSQGMWLGFDPYANAKLPPDLVPFSSKMESRPIPDYTPGIKFKSDFGALERFANILSECQPSEVFNTVKKQVPIAARMFKGGAIDLTEAQCIDILHKALCKAPGTTNPKLALTQVESAWKNAIKKYEPITPDDLKKKEFLDKMTFWMKTGWYDTSIPYALVGSKIIYETFAANDEGLLYVNRESSSEQAIRQWTGSAEAKNRVVMQMPKCAMFVNEPDFINYQKIVTLNTNDGSHIRGFNLCLPLPIDPVEGDWSNLKAGIEWSFQNAFDYEGKNGTDFFLDYCCVLFRHPKEKLPGLLLKSKVHGRAAKSTLVKVLLHMMGYNGTKIRMSDFTNNFNASYADKVLTVIDETEFGDAKYNDSVTSIFKNLISEDVTTIEFKGIDSKPIPNRNHVILMSNKDKPIAIESEDNRWAVVEMPPIPTERIDPMMKNKYLEEAPAFLYYLLFQHEIKYEKCSRIWFPEAMFDTPAKRAIQERSKSQMYEGFVGAVGDWFASNPTKTEIRFILDNLKTFMDDHDIKWYGNSRSLIDMMSRDLDLERKQIRIEGGKAGKGWVLSKDHPVISLYLEDFVSTVSTSVSIFGNGQNLLDYLHT